MALHALELVPCHPHLEAPAAARAVPGGEEPLGQTDRVEDERRLLDRVAGEVWEQPAEPDPVVAVRLTGIEDEREPDPPFPLTEQHARAGTRRLGGRHPVHRLVDGTDPGPGDDQHAGLGVCPGRLEPGLVRAALPHPVVGVCCQLDVRVPHAWQVSDASRTPE